MAYSLQQPRFVHEVSCLAGGNIPGLMEMAEGEERLFWFGLDYVLVVRLNTDSLFAACPLSLSGRWHKLNLEPTVTAFNGQRWWYVCPTCTKRKAALFWQREKFGCRKCMGLRYQSQYLTFENEFERLCHRVKKERIAIWGQDEPDIECLLRSSGSFKRPKGMRKKTFNRKLERLCELENVWMGVTLRHLNSWKEAE